MKTALVTGSGGLIGSEAVRFLFEQGFTKVIGIDNDKRKWFFGPEGSTYLSAERLKTEFTTRYTHYSVDINDICVEGIFQNFSSDIELIIHAAAQPSHDLSAKYPIEDFKVNALGTVNLLEYTRKYCPDAVFIFCSTNKVYGDSVNQLQYTVDETRYSPLATEFRIYGIDENMPIDDCLHSPFGVSKASADLMVQEYARYFGLHTGIFRGGCLTGPNHAAVQLHGFLSYLVKCAMTKTPYTVVGYEGKQVRDNIHCRDLLSAFFAFYLHPHAGEVYNIGGGRFANCSILEAVSMIEGVTGNKIQLSFDPKPRVGDHKWWISDTRKFQAHYPGWDQQYSILQTITEIVEDFRHQGL